MNNKGLKQASPPYKNRKNKTSFGKKQFWGKFRRWGKVKTHKPNFKKKIEDSLEEKYSLFQYMQT